MAAQKRKDISMTDRKGKKASGVTIFEHILRCLRLDYLKDEGRRDVHKKNLERMGYGMLSDLP
jgi:hypothetical protein